MCLGKIKFNNIFGCVEFMNYEPSTNGTYLINIWFVGGDDNVSIETIDVDVCEKMFNTICNRLATYGYCNIDKFNLDGDYIDVLLS